MVWSQSPSTTSLVTVGLNSFWLVSKAVLRSTGDCSIRRPSCAEVSQAEKLKRKQQATVDPQDLADLLIKAKQLQAALVDLQKIRHKSSPSIHPSGSLRYPARADEQTLFAVGDDGTAGAAD